MTFPQAYRLLVLLPLLLLGACDKGYQLRFTNYYTQPMDSVVIGNRIIVFKNVGLQSTTEYKKLMAGKHGVYMYTKSEEQISGEILIPSKGSGKRTLQIDAIKQVVLLED